MHTFYININSKHTDSEGVCAHIRHPEAPTDDVVATWRLAAGQDHPNLEGRALYGPGCRLHRHPRPPKDARKLGCNLLCMDMEEEGVEGERMGRARARSRH